MLSLSPRFDLFTFKFPKDFIPEPVEKKYFNLINKDKAIITSVIDYLNESIQQVSIPGIANLAAVEQNQQSSHLDPQTPTKTGKKINVEPFHRNTTYTSQNPLDNITMEFTVTFRQNQGLYNYFLMYETIFYKVLKKFHGMYWDDVFYLDILDEHGVPTARITLFQPRVDGIDGLSFNYNKVERNVETFDVKFKFNNIDFDFLPNEKEQQ